MRRRGAGGWIGGAVLHQTFLARQTQPPDLGSDRAPSNEDDGHRHTGHPPTRRLSTYVVITAVTGVIDILVLVMLHAVTQAPLWFAAVAAYAASGCANFGMHARLTYRRQATLRTIGAFCSVAVVNLVVTSVGTHFAAQHGLPYLVAKGLLMVVLLATNYFALGRFVFVHRSFRVNRSF